MGGAEGLWAGEGAAVDGASDGERGEEEDTGATAAVVRGAEP